jgi:RNA polymerase sigma factor (sigma-70 family)
VFPERAHADSASVAAPVLAPSVDSSLDVDYLYREHNAALVRLCESILRDSHSAADAAQDTWIRASGALRAGVVPSNFRAWLFTIARNRCTDALRVVRTQAIDEQTEALAASPALEEQHEQRAELDMLWTDVRTLSEAQRTAFLLSEVHGMSSAEVALATGRPPEACRGLVAAARAALRERRAGRELHCETARVQIRSASERGRGVDAHLACCSACRDELRRERGRRLIRSLALVPLPGGAWSRLGARIADVLNRAAPLRDHVVVGLTGAVCALAVTGASIEHAHQTATPRAVSARATAPARQASLSGPAHAARAARRARAQARVGRAGSANRPAGLPTAPIAPSGRPASARLAVPSVPAAAAGAPTSTTRLAATAGSAEKRVSDAVDRANSTVRKISGAVTSVPAGPAYTIVAGVSDTAAALSLSAVPHL